jgi:hypothetical protein
MNRRKVLQGLAALPIVAAFAGCPRHDDKDQDDHQKPETHPGSSKVRTLRIMLHGPFAVVLQKDKNYRIKAYVPYDAAHEFRFQTLQEPLKKQPYQFTLREESVEDSGQPYIDRGFDGFNVDIPKWKPPSDSFVSLDLPPARVISYVPPLEAVQFEPSPEFPAGQLTSLPLNHVLEYRVKEGCKVVLHSDQLGDCMPLSCDDLHEQYIKLWNDDGYMKQVWKERYAESKSYWRPPMDQVLTRCSQSDVCYLFLGVGLSPQPRKETPLDGYDHALKFFNEKLLPSLYGSDIPKGKRIMKLDASPCTSSGGLSTSPMLVPAMQRLPFPRARYLPVASTENCTAPCATATAIRSYKQ